MRQIAGVMLVGLGACVGGGEPRSVDSGLAAEPTAERVARVLDLPGDDRRGRDLYDDDGCADCHGSYASGTDDGPRLVSTGLDLDYVVTVVIEGSGTMPSHSGWTDQELADLTTYLDDDVLYASDCRDGFRCD